MESIRSQKGMTLLEMVMLIVVLSIGILSFGGTITNIIRLSTNSYIINKATVLANNVIEEFEAYRRNNLPKDWWTFAQQLRDDHNANTDNLDIDGEGFTRTVEVVKNSNVTDNIFDPGNDFDRYFVTVTVSHPSLSSDVKLVSMFTVYQEP